MIDIRKLVAGSMCRCWACGRTEFEQPSYWGAPWLIENAHIIGGPTRSSQQDCREAIVLLCSQCHRLSHGETLAGLEPRPERLYRENLIWLKMQRDPVYYRRELLAKWSTGALPRARRLPLWYSRQWQSRCVAGWK